MQKTSFTVILTTYNSGKAVLSIIDSIRNQEGEGIFFDLELIIVDDCSTDGTREFLTSKGIQFQSTSVNSGGANKGRNIALDMASKEWIIIADHDDVWLPNRLITLSKIETDAEVISSAYEIEDTKMKTRRSLVLDNQPLLSYYQRNETFLALIQKKKDDRQISYLGALCFRNSSDIPRFEEQVGKVDFDWICRLFYQRSSLHVNEALYVRIQDGRNLSRNEAYRLADLEISTNYLDSISAEYPIETLKGKRGLMGTMARYYYSQEQMMKARKYFMKAGFATKNILYFITSFVGYKLINKKVRVFD